MVNLKKALCVLAVCRAVTMKAQMFKVSLGAIITFFVVFSFSCATLKEYFEKMNSDKWIIESFSDNPDAYYIVAPYE
jgi:hypothetical protein